jgi:hypothetical protein
MLTFDVKHIYKGLAQQERVHVPASPPVYPRDHATPQQRR